MKKNTFPLEPGRFYHIYNRGINGGQLFFNHQNYLYFLKLIVELPFRRKNIDDREQLIKTIIYINKNPAKHKIAKDCLSYPYSSADEIIKNENRFVESHEVLSLFNDVDEFKKYFKCLSSLKNKRKRC